MASSFSINTPSGGRTFYAIEDINGNGILDNKFFPPSNEFISIESRDDGNGRLEGEELQNLFFLERNHETGELQIVSAEELGIISIDLVEAPVPLSADPFQVNFNDGTTETGYTELFQWSHPFGIGDGLVFPEKEPTSPQPWVGY